MEGGQRVVGAMVRTERVCNGMLAASVLSPGESFTITLALSRADPPLHVDASTSNLGSYSLTPKSDRHVRPHLGRFSPTYSFSPHTTFVLFSLRFPTHK
jgi:hypothetical protein